MKKLFLPLFIFVVLTRPCLALDISARSAVVIEAQRGRVIYEKSAGDRLPMASTTKIMTAICALETSEPEKLITVDNSAVGVEGSSIYLKKGEKLRLIDLVYGLMLNSGNDAAVAIACGVSGTVEEFVALMNAKAREIGAEDTCFTNPNGLPDKEHFTTATDLAKITAYAMKNHVFREIVSTKATTIPDSSGERYLSNHNKLLKTLEGCIGVKTGFTKDSGRCLVSACRREDAEIITVTLGAPDDWNDHAMLAEYAFDRLDRISVTKKGQPLGRLKVTGGKSGYIDALWGEDCSITALEGQIYVGRCHLPERLCAPVERGTVLGAMEVFEGDSLVATVPFVAGADVMEDPGPSLKKTVLKLARCFWSFGLGED